MIDSVASTGGTLRRGKSVVSTLGGDLEGSESGTVKSPGKSGETLEQRALDYSNQVVASGPRALTGRIA